MTQRLERRLMSGAGNVGYEVSFGSELVDPALSAWTINSELIQSDLICSMSWIPCNLVVR